jgi:BASS family bile acid:Na+ symporter
MVRGGLQRLARWAMPIIGASIFAGLLLPELATALRPTLEPGVVILIALAITRLDPSQLRHYSRQPGLATAVLGWSLLISPAAALAIGWAIGLAPALLIAVVLNAASAPLISSVPFCQLLGLDGELALLAVLSGTLLLPVTLPVVIFGLLGMEAEIAPGDFLIRTAIFIVLPLLLAWGIRRLAPMGWIEANSREIDGGMVIMLVLVAFAIMDGIAVQLVADPAHAAVIVATAFTVSIALHLSSAAAFWRMGRRSALSMAVTCGNRNLIILLVIVGGALGPDFALYVALGQFPIYLMPVVIQPIVRWLLRHAPS